MNYDPFGYPIHPGDPSFIQCTGDVPRFGPEPEYQEPSPPVEPRPVEPDKRRRWRGRRYLDGLFGALKAVYPQKAAEREKCRPLEYEDEEENEVDEQDE